MKVLAISGSPRKEGIVSRLATQVLEGAKENGHETENINLYDYDLNYCRGCWKCAFKGECVLKDDFNALFNKVKEADVLVLASPTYWSNVSGIMKTFLDRQCGMALNHPEGKHLFGMKFPVGLGPSEEMMGKETIYITACTAPYPFNILYGESSNTLRALRAYSENIHAINIGKLIFSDSRFKNQKNKEGRYLQKAYSMGKMI